MAFLTKFHLEYFFVGKDRAKYRYHCDFLKNVPLLVPSLLF